MSIYAIDFGTSNSLINFISANGKITKIPLADDGSFVLRSLLYSAEKGAWSFGKEAIEEYVETDGEGRFFKSIKKFLPDPSYSGTEVFNKKLKIDDLVSIYLKHLKDKADDFIGEKVVRVVLGRPALYSSDPIEDELAQERMFSAAKKAGFSEVHFCPEPVAAGINHVDTDKANEKVLIADFGGGTSDFTLLNITDDGYSKESILGISGIFKAGDAFDGECMNKFIAPHFGSNFEYQLPASSNVLKFPKNLLKKMCSPAHITHLREKDTWEFLQQIKKHSIDTENKKKIDNLFNLVEYQLGFPVFEEIERCKIDLCNDQVVESKYRFIKYEVEVSEVITKDEFFNKLSPTVESIIDCLFEVFSKNNLKPSDVDKVYLTGGSSQFIPLLNKIEDIFVKSEIVYGGVYDSVVRGLSSYALKLL